MLTFFSVFGKTEPPDAIRRYPTLSKSSFSRKSKKLQKVIFHVFTFRPPTLSDAIRRYPTLLFYHFSCFLEKSDHFSPFSGKLSRPTLSDAIRRYRKVHFRGKVKNCKNCTSRALHESSRAQHEHAPSPPCVLQSPPLPRPRPQSS